VSLTCQLQGEYSVKAMLILWLNSYAGLNPLFISRIDAVHVYDHALPFTLVDVVTITSIEPFPNAITLIDIAYCLIHNPLQV
jgi:hypothetical protein